MSLAPREVGPAHSASSTDPPQSNGRPLHCISDVRKRQGVSIRSAARQIKVDIRQARLQENPNTDLQLSSLYEWQKALSVPVSELLVDLDAPLSAPVLKRAQMLRLMKSARAIFERAPNGQIRRLARMMIEQLIEMMPELAHVCAWQEEGVPRTNDEYGLAAFCRQSKEAIDAAR
jgi:transcriptional regulator with XRE-family HTH domain